MTLKYLWVEITGERNRYIEITRQATKTNKVCGCPGDTIWKNKNKTRESKIKIYKTIVRPTLTQAAETRVD